MKKFKTEVVYTLSAKAYLLDENDNKLDFVETVPQMEQFKVRQNLRMIGANIFKTAMEADVPDQKYHITWAGLFIYLELFAPLDSQFSVLTFISTFHEAAADTYLEGDADVYNGKNIAFDDFKVTDGGAYGKASPKQRKTKKFANYWSWAKPPTVIKEWHMWSGEDEDISVSIRNNTSPIPFGKEVVTKAKTIWFEWGEDDAAVAIFSKTGFRVKDVVTAIQEILTEDYETKIPNMFNDDEIGSIDTVFFNPVTKHVSIGVAFD